MLQREEAKKQETNTSTPTISSSSPWSSSSSRSKADHRIVRVSRAFGGKDRHSKVCTVRGLRDRRVRLSVPTAIQLYDLQDRLGLSQPSKVVDWLLEAAKHEIEELPPLQFPPSMMMGLINNSNADESNVPLPPPPFDSLISSSWDHQSQPSISLGLNDQTNLDLHNFGLLLSSTTTSNQVLDYQHQHQQAEISNSTQPYFPYTYNRH